MRNVAPFAGAWIEMIFRLLAKLLIIVAPFAGAWIEITFTGSLPSGSLSLPSRERGLKCLPFQKLIFPLFVAPFAGAWIEIGFAGNHIFNAAHRRSLRGSVD